MKTTTTATGAQGSGPENSDPDHAYTEALKTDPETLVWKEGEKRKAMRLPCRTHRAAREIGEVIGFPPEDVVNLAVHSTLAHVRRNNCLAAPFRIVAFTELLVDPGVEDAGRLESMAKTLGVAYKDVAGVLVRIALDAIDAGELRAVRMGPAAALLPVADAAKPPFESGPKPPHVRPKQMRQLLAVADLLNVLPQDFLDWHIGPMLNDVLNPGTGEMRQWAEENLEYDTAEEKARVITRVAAWSGRETRRRERRLERALARRKPSKESEVAA